MKQIYTLTFLLAACLAGYSNKITFTKATGSWTDNSAWDLYRQPVSGDTIIIPAGNFVFMTATANLNGVVLQINGSLRLAGGKLNFDNNSKANVSNHGQITGNSSDEIKIGGVTKFIGSEGAQLGPSYADKTTGMAPVNGFATNSLLPVTFTAFYVSKNGNNADLTWSTAQEFNNYQFEIEKSTDGRNWTQIGSVAGAGTVNTPATYHFSDKNITAAVLYYRIRQVDLNGQEAFSSVKVLRFNGSNPVTKVYSTGKNVNVEFNTPVNTAFSIRVMNMNGQLVSQQNFQQSAYRIVMNLGQAGNGAYVVQVVDNSGLAESTKVIL